jgi:hypothetical protein
MPFYGAFAADGDFILTFSFAAFMGRYSMHGAATCVGGSFGRICF